MSAAMEGLEPASSPLSSLEEDDLVSVEEEEEEGEEESAAQSAFKESMSKFHHESTYSPSLAFRQKAPAVEIKSPRKRKAPKTVTSSVKRITRSASAAASSTTPPSPTPSKVKPKRKVRLPSPDPTGENVVNNLRDVMRDDLHVLFVGVNPGLLTAQTGWAYSHPSNRFYPLLFVSGITTRKCKPSEYYDLAEEFGLGHTNVVKRPTRDASRLSAKEMEDGIIVVEEKVREWKPGCVVLVGKSVWEAVERAWTGMPEKFKTAQVKIGPRLKAGTGRGLSGFHYGWQDINMGRIEPKDGQEGWEGAPIFVATTSSGLAASMSWEEKVEVWKELGDWVNERREKFGRVGGAPRATEGSNEVSNGE